MTIDREARKNTVLEAIIKAHVESALPIGSKWIGNVLGLSSATIRNVMSELEEDGYIKQPHTSAGRIPTDLGYRRYVDNMASSMKHPQDGVFSKVRRYLNEKKVFEEVVEAASRALSEITSYTGIACLSGRKLYFDGTYHMLEQPEFRELSMARDFLRIIEERDELLRIMNDGLGTDGTTIRIGRENMFDGLRECAIVTSVYKVKRHVSGNIGVIGPMRMKYEEVVPVVEGLAEMTTEILEEILR